MSLVVFQFNNRPVLPGGVYAALLTRQKTRMTHSSRLVLRDDSVPAIRLAILPALVVSSGISALSLCVQGEVIQFAFRD